MSRIVPTEHLLKKIIVLDWKTQKQKTKINPEYLLNVNFVETCIFSYVKK